MPAQIPARPPAHISVRPARPDELGWINGQYAAIDFVASGKDELIAVAEVDGQRAGLGRIVPIEAGIGELGGMLVFDRWRGLGLAKRIIAFLQEQARLHGRFHTLYCLPFAELEALYAQLGFTRAPCDAPLPGAIAAKHAWCNTHYTRPVLLMWCQWR